MDSGPIVAQAAVSVRPGDTEEGLAARVLKVEHQIYPLALKLVAEGRVRVENGRCLVDRFPFRIPLHWFPWSKFLHDPT
jgi:folate-dependent phosphoribosylglycinamide formyltransferase PurN